MPPFVARYVLNCDFEYKNNIFHYNLALFCHIIIIMYQVTYRRGSPRRHCIIPSNGFIVLLKKKTEYKKSRNPLSMWVRKGSII